MTGLGYSLFFANESLKEKKKTGDGMPVKFDTRYVYRIE